MPTKTKTPRPRAAAKPKTPAKTVMQTLPLTMLAPHPDNIRRRIGDVAELAKSIQGTGILEPLLVLPAGEDGKHLVVAGHRRLAAARKAKLAEAPCIVRDLDPAEVLEAMLVENVQRADITPVEEGKAYARLTTELGHTVKELARKVGRSEATVKSRLNLVTLPDEVLAEVEAGKVTLGDAEKLTAFVDDDDAMAHLAGNPTLNPWAIERYVNQRDREAAIASEREKLAKAGLTEFQKPAGWWTPYSLTSLSKPVPVKLLGFTATQHKGEPCHQVLLDTSYSTKVERVPICTQPKRHTTEGPAKNRSELQVTADVWSKSANEPDQGDKQRGEAAAACRAAASARSAWLDTLDLHSLPLIPAPVARGVINDAAADEVQSAFARLHPGSVLEEDQAEAAAWEACQAAMGDPVAGSAWAWSFTLDRAELEAKSANDRWSLPGSRRLARFHMAWCQSHGYELSEWETAWCAEYDAKTADPEPVDVDELGLSDELATLLAEHAKAGEAILPAGSALLTDLEARGYAEIDRSRSEAPGLVVAVFTATGAAVAATVLEGGDL